jgi:two-component system phosphate regulon response regulator OmpR
MSDAIRILVVDDDPEIRQFLQDYLSEHGYEVLEADSGPTARALLAEPVPAVALLDVGLPGEDGLTLARWIRERFDIGIIMVSGAGETVDRIIGLEVGADDYLAKPFDPRELRARVKSVLRRYQRPAVARPPEASAGTPSTTATRRVPIGTGRLDLDSCQLFGADGQEIPVTRMEFELLRVFVERPNRPLSRDQLMMLTQNRDWDPYDRSLDIRIVRLRRKIEADPDHPRSLRTVRGVGYMFVP